MSGHRKRLCLAPLLLLLVGDVTSADVDHGLLEHVRAGQIEAVRELLSETTPDLDAADETGWTALMYAVEGGQAEIVGMLLEAGASPDRRNPSGQTALHLAALYGRTAAARLLLRAGADHELRDAEGRTPLYRAIEKRRVDIIEMLQAAELARGQGVLSRAPMESSERALPPRIVESTPAPYTPTARAEGIEGKVVLMVLVRRDGTVGAASVSRGLEPSLDESALRSVKEWKFAPAMRNRRTVEVVLEVDVEFHLPDEP
jgi:TonB family protein